MATNPSTSLSDRDTDRSAQNLLTRLTERFSSTANAKNVFGEPIEAHGRTVIPIAKVGYGLGGSRGAADGGGGGAGGGVGAKPAGYIEITDQGTRYVPMSTPRNLALAALAGLAAGYLLAKIGR